MFSYKLYWLASNSKRGPRGAALCLTKTIYITSPPSAPYGSRDTPSGACNFWHRRISSIHSPYVAQLRSHARTCSDSSISLFDFVLLDLLDTYFVLSRRRKMKYKWGICPQSAIPLFPSVIRSAIHQQCFALLRITFIHLHDHTRDQNQSHPKMPYFYLSRPC